MLGTIGSGRRPSTFRGDGPHPGLKATPLPILGEGIRRRKSLDPADHGRSIEG